MPKLTKSMIDRAKPDETRDWCLWEDGKPTGVKSFVIQYRTADGRSRRMTLGRYGKLTLEQARKQAQRAFGEIAQGHDPVHRRKAQRRGETVGDLAVQYLDQHADRKKKPRSALDDRQMIERLQRRFSEFWRKSVGDVTRSDIARLHHQMADIQVAANRAIALISKMMTLAEKWGLRPDGSNPCRFVERYPERPRERSLSDDELLRLGRALSEAEGNGAECPQVIAAIRLLIFTGARRGEILTLRWEYVDTKRRVIRLPDSKSGAKTIHLNGPAVRVLERLEPSDDWVLPGRRRGQPLANIAKPWDRIRRAAGLDGLRLHDLRHSFASVGAGAGMSLHLIGRLLGHAQTTTTQRYAHLQVDPLLEASEAIASRISEAMDSHIP
jgi:integrase